MKKCLFVLFTLLSLCVCAQTPGQKKARFNPEKYRQVMERFVMEKAGVTQDEAKTFFPIFHEMLNEQRKVRREIGKLTHEGKLAKSEADYKRIMERIVDLEIKQNEIEKSYYKRFSEVLSWEKMFKVKCAIQEFGMEALNKFYPRNSHRRNEK